MAECPEAEVEGITFLFGKCEPRKESLTPVPKNETTRKPSSIVSGRNSSFFPLQSTVFRNTSNAAFKSQYSQEFPAHHNQSNLFRNDASHRFVTTSNKLDVRNGDGFLGNHFSSFTRENSNNMHHAQRPYTSSLDHNSLRAFHDVAAHEESISLHHGSSQQGQYHSNNYNSRIMQPKLDYMQYSSRVPSRAHDSLPHYGVPPSESINNFVAHNNNVFPNNTSHNGIANQARLEENSLWNPVITPAHHQSQYTGRHNVGQSSNSINVDQSIFREQANFRPHYQSYQLNYDSSHSRELTNRGQQHNIFNNPF